MAEEFQAGICSDNWWSSSRSVLVAVGGLSPCSVGIGDLGWPPADDFVNIKPPKSATDSHNSILFPDSMGFALSSSPTSDWNQTDDLLCGGGGGESNFNSNGIETNNDSRSINGFKEAQENGDYLLEENRLNSSMINCSSTSAPSCQGLFPLDSTLYGYPSSKLVPSLYDDPEPHQQPHGHPLFNTRPSINTNTTFPTNNNPNDSSTPNFPSNYLKPSLPNHPQPVSPALHFTNNTPFWNPSSPPSTHIIPHPILSSSQTQVLASLLEHKNPISQNTALAPFKTINSANCEDGGQEPKKCDKNSTAEPPVFKRPRIETPSPLPTFKVRKEKLGDRVTALQQLVSPFGKTDTASVLHEAIDYIKFLHNQVSVLSTPYMKSNNGTPLQHQQVSEKSDPDCPKQDLRSRGLCLVPISSTFPVTNATTPDFWTPTFGGTFR